MSTPMRDQAPTSGSGTSTLVNALLGAAVTVLASFTVVSPVLGGAVAGYLEEGDGLRVGTISGLIATIPLFVVVLLLTAVVGVFALDAGVVVLLVGTFAFGVVAVYTIVLSALGGYLGEYLAREYGGTSRTVDRRY